MPPDGKRKPLLGKQCIGKEWGNFPSFIEQNILSHTKSLSLTLHCKCLHTNYRLTIVFICYYYIWKCVKCLQVVEFEYYRQISVFSAVNSKLHSNYWYLDVKWKCILFHSEIRYISWQFLQLKICNWFTIQGKYK